MNMFEEGLLVIIGSLVVLVNRFTEAFVTPIFDKFSLDKFWVMYIAWVIAGILVFLTGINVFAELIPNQIVGQILTALLGGGGANILHNLTDKE
jgi:hypothetical protein